MDYETSLYDTNIGLPDVCQLIYVSADLLRGLMDVYGLNDLLRPMIECLPAWSKL